MLHLMEVIAIATAAYFAVAIPLAILLGRALKASGADAELDGAPRAGIGATRHGAVEGAPAHGALPWVV